MPCWAAARRVERHTVCRAFGRTLEPGDNLFISVRLNKRGAHMWEIGRRAGSIVRKRLTRSVFSNACASMSNSPGSSSALSDQLVTLLVATSTATLELLLLWPEGMHGKGGLNPKRLSATPTGCGSERKRPKKRPGRASSSKETRAQFNTLARREHGREPRCDGESRGLR